MPWFFGIALLFILLLGISALRRRRRPAAPASSSYRDGAAPGHSGGRYGGPAGSQERDGVAPKPAGNWSQPQYSPPTRPPADIRGGEEWQPPTVSAPAPHWPPPLKSPPSAPAPSAQPPSAPQPAPAEYTGVFGATAPPKSDLAPNVALDKVHLSLTGPAAIAPGQAFPFQFWVHFQSDLNEILERARTMLHTPSLSEMLFASEGPFQLQRGARLSIKLRIAGLGISTPHKTVLWDGEIGSTSFLVVVPAAAQEGSRKGMASIRVNGAQIAKLEFVVYINAVASATVYIPTQLSVHKNAFASYASEDRDAVVARIQGMQKAVPALQCFLDVSSLRSGQYWEQELWKRIEEADVLYLFWCRHARASSWVEKEWRFALEKKGLDFIDPVPLENPQIAPPPPELASKHFNDPLLAFIAAQPDGSHSWSQSRSPSESFRSLTQQA